MTEPSNPGSQLQKFLGFEDPVDSQWIQVLVDELHHFVDQIGRQTDLHARVLSPTITSLGWESTNTCAINGGWWISHIPTFDASPPNIRLSKVRLSKTALGRNQWLGYRAWVRIGFCKIGWLAAKKDHFICRSLDLEKKMPIQYLHPFCAIDFAKKINYHQPSLQVLIINLFSSTSSVKPPISGTHPILGVVSKFADSIPWLRSPKLPRNRTSKNGWLLMVINGG